MTPTPVVALRGAYPHDLPDDAAAAAWLRRRRDVLTARVAGDADGTLAVSSGCAASGAARHRSALTEQAVLALSRLEDGSLVRCLSCDAPLAFDRLDAAPGVVACAACRRATSGGVDTRWCR